jgi:membrane-associated progesterone receptor component
MLPESSTKDMASRLFNSVINSPLNLALVGLICFFTYRLFIRSDSSSKQEKNDGKRKRQLNKMKKQDFTLESLRPFDGLHKEVEAGRILIGVLGRVFDVSSSGDFYGPGGPYSVFAGRDASRALATFSVDADQLKDTHDDLADLTSSQMESVKEWEMQFLEKYPVVGKLLKPGEESINYDDESSSSETTESAEVKKDN